jgi:hypothetical protein
MNEAVSLCRFTVMVWRASCVCPLWYAVRAMRWRACLLFGWQVRDALMLSRNRWKSDSSLQNAKHLFKVLSFYFCSLTYSNMPARDGIQNDPSVPWGLREELQRPSYGMKIRRFFTIEHRGMSYSLWSSHDRRASQPCCKMHREKRDPVSELSFSSLSRLQPNSGKMEIN